MSGHLHHFGTRNTNKETGGCGNPSIKMCQCLSLFTFVYTDVHEHARARSHTMDDKRVCPTGRCFSGFADVVGGKRTKILCPVVLPFHYPPFYTPPRLQDHSKQTLYVSPQLGKSSRLRTLKMEPRARVQMCQGQGPPNGQDSLTVPSACLSHY